jgi:hypothetical protein
VKKGSKFEPESFDKQETTDSSVLVGLTSTEAGGLLLDSLEDDDSTSVVPSGHSFNCE